MNAIIEIELKKIIHDTPASKVGYNSDISTVIFVINGFLKYEQFVTLSEILMKTIEIYKPKNLLSDIRAAKVLSKEIQDYNNTALAPFLAKSSIKKNGMLVSEDIFLKFTVSAIENKFKSDFKFEVKHFTKYEQFLDWIK